MNAVIVEFIARGAAKTLSAAIEAHALERRVVTALVVPWESDADTLRMAVTSTRSDGWAIEHTNLGTIALSELGGGLTRVAVLAGLVQEAGNAVRELDLQDEQRRLLTAFAHQLERKFGTAPGEAAPVEISSPRDDRVEP